MALADVVTEVLRLLGATGEGRRVEVAARGHEVELVLDRLALHPPVGGWSAGAAPGIWPRSLEAWAAASPDDWLAAANEAWRSTAGRWPAAPSWLGGDRRDPAWSDWLVAPLGGLTIGLHDVVVDRQPPLAQLEIVA